ncbi:glutamate synthase [bacterium (Candidatus Blackallbacteria) CG17_big_fil_post_rev_8_21_14_2_50_48_46]|uniref:Glutamate synthase n=1 Tax=bacterium (Candidatus Blackallbacteria) CG17_big_fil_post_rev_8_21_14_2_50_48_46 TaxID=2014261 RepID=A0A2M7FXI2_9BACT|nr:MAG: glutamate synthase [bacterium (Candidatus Blackallbacteria) CG18_big_fil_WC_8_21_14_2_50_49_26]PIW13792.1 MAG: glutamate synthase [bacterium (Candidatus Blackallbacteria) CG17_big_fil_post_rev_8_21_14_2_50_48_46]PIW45018.1 MAG: glutamate synthase [bacterium (Candidatus Blackallbacteria) CG13_big_fil_rev_8_21_14_2_50_49_14]
MKKTAWLSLLILLMGAAHPPESELKQVRSAAGALLTQLQSTLKAALQSQGPAAAVEVCHQVAPGIAAQIAETEGVEIRRVSLRSRNPQNQPDAYEQKVLEQWSQNPTAIPEEHFEVVQEGQKQVLRYLKPLKIQAVCLQCHGPAEKIKPEVQALLKKYYPQDQATGYHEGDLRGAVTVRHVLTLEPQL